MRSRLSGLKPRYGADTAMALCEMVEHCPHLRSSKFNAIDVNYITVGKCDSEQYLFCL